MILVDTSKPMKGQQEALHEEEFQSVSTKVNLHVIFICCMFCVNNKVVINVCATHIVTVCTANTRKAFTLLIAMVGMGQYIMPTMA